jgi:DMSO reductase family type II enzyme chaperone
VDAAGDRPVTGSAAVQDAVARALARASVYRILAAAFSYPSPLRLRDVAESAAAAAQASPAVRGPLADLADAARAAEPDALAAEYVFLFERQVRCAPYEGAYGDAPAMAGKGAMLADIAGFYAAFGLSPGGGRADAEDHIAAELEFMAALALKEAWALAQADADGTGIIRAAAKAFLADHLGRWAERFAEACRSATPLAFYGAAAALLADWMRRELAAFGVSVAPLAGRLPADPLHEGAFTCPMAEPPEEPA